jgi:hypothetical protein
MWSFHGWAKGLLFESGPSRDKQPALCAQRKRREDRAIELEAQASIFLPGYMASVVRKAEDGDLELVELSRVSYSCATGMRPSVSNARDDQILKGKFWRGSFEERRCLVRRLSSVSRATRAPLCRSGHTHLRGRHAKDGALFVCESRGFDMLGPASSGGVLTLWAVGTFALLLAMALLPF